jgi:Zn-dependent peptidase ImmA (M78 family)
MRDDAASTDVYADFREVGAHVFRRKLGSSNISGVFIAHPVAGRCALINYDEDVYRQRFSAAHEMAHAIFDADDGASVSFVRPDRNDLIEIRANQFASCYLMPPALLRRIHATEREWTDGEVIKCASQLKVSCSALGIALNEAGLVGENRSAAIRQLRVHIDEKVDPELPPDLNDTQRLQKVALLEMGLSDFYVSLCFDAARKGTISSGRLAEALLCTASELPKFENLYGRRATGI